MSALVVGGAVAAAVLAAAGPGARPPVRHVRRAGEAVQTRAVAGGSVDLAAALLVVSAQLRSGASPAAAWARALGVVPRGADVPTATDLLAATAPPPRAVPPQVRAVLGRLGGAPPAGWAALVPGHRERVAAHRERVAAVLAATGLADELGAPLAAVLERLARAVAADAEAEAVVRAAVAGPRATARVLTWLPALGLVVGAALGADPVAVVRHGGVGALAALVGVALLVAGRVWTAALLRRAALAGRAT